MIWTIKKGLFRFQHYAMNLIIRMLRFPVPEIVSGAGSIGKLPAMLKKRNIGKVLIVTDAVLEGLGLIDVLKSGLREAGIEFAVFSNVQPNPTIMNVENTKDAYLEHSCRAFIALGGGSVMDCAKIAAARVANPRKSVVRMRGQFKVNRKIPPFFAVPTTAGTGSETTVCAVISNPETHEKFAITDLKLVPDIAVLDPELMRGLPPHITASTGMDALTHAVEAYIGLNGTIKAVSENAKNAVRLVFENLEKVYADGADMEARTNMALASFYGGAAFTRAYVGYVHAAAHNLGGMYGVPHGLANAVILPYVLDESKHKCTKKLAELAVAGGIGNASEPQQELAERFIAKIKQMNKAMGIPLTIKEIKAEDIPLIAERAYKEGNPSYPVPRIFSRMDFEKLLTVLMQ